MILESFQDRGTLKRGGFVNSIFVNILKAFGLNLPFEQKAFQPNIEKMQREENLCSCRQPRAF